jgi:futalosine hydrolase
MAKKKNVGIISSVPFESEFLLNTLNLKNKISADITAGRIGGNPLIHITSGIGITNAAHAATVLIERYSPRLIVLMGIGGAYPGSGLGIEDIALAEKEIYADLGVPTNNGYLSIKKTGIPLMRKGGKTYYNEFLLEKNLLKQSRKALSTQNLKTGVFLTISRITVTRKKALQLRETYSAICENMEGAAVAHICKRYGTPMLEIRGISNMVDDRNPEKWRKDAAAVKCQKAVAELLTFL